MYALVEASYNFMFIDTGYQGRISDGSVFKDSVLAKIMDTRGLNLPRAEALAGNDKSLPYFFLADCFYLI